METGKPKHEVTVVELGPLDLSAPVSPQATPYQDGRAENHGRPDEVASLPPVDGGKHAWLFLAACYLVEMMTWGFLFSFGTFQNYYSLFPPFAKSASIATIGTCAMGIMYLDCPIVIALFRAFPRQARWFPIAGLVVMCGALAASSFATRVSHLVATQGLLYGLGGSVAYAPCIVYLDEWFDRRKGLAYGIMWSSTSLAGAVLPLLLDYLLMSRGFRFTLRLWAALVFAVVAPLTLFLKPRLPVGGNRFNNSSSISSIGSIKAKGRESLARMAKPFMSLHFLVSRPFALYQLCNTAEAVGFFLPAIYLPTFARVALGASPYLAVLTLLLINVAAALGSVAMGVLIDRFHVSTCLLVSAAGTVAGTLVLWGLSDSLPALYAFCVVYGLFAGGFTSAWPGIMRDVAAMDYPRKRSTCSFSSSSYSSRSCASASSATGPTIVVASPEDDGTGAGHAPDSRTDPMMVFAFLAVGRGVGNIVSGPLSEALVATWPWTGRAMGAYSTAYGALVIFTAVTALVGGGSFLCRKVGWL